MAVKSLPATAFAKALRSLETGGLTQNSMMAEIKELLAAGASATELRDILLGRDLIEPLSVAARAEMLGILNGAMLRERQRAAAAEKPDTPEVASTTPAGSSATPPNAPSGPDVALPTAESSALSRITALEAALAAARAALESERKTTRDAARAAAKAAADNLVALETARARADQAAADAEHFRTEAQSLHDSLDERDATLAQMRQSLGKREAQLAALSKEHAEMSSALDARTRSVTQLQDDIKAVRARESSVAADLERASSALEAEQVRAQANSKSLVEKLVSTEAALARAEGALRGTADQQSETQSIRDALAGREAELAALQREHANQAAALQAQEKKRLQLESDLQAAHARVDEAPDLESNAGRTAQLEADLRTARARAEEALGDSRRYQAEARTLLDTIATHAADRAAFQREYDKKATALESHETYVAQLEAELQKARARVDTLEKQLHASMGNTRALDAHPEPVPPRTQTVKLESVPTVKVAQVIDIKEKPSAHKVSAPNTRRPVKIPTSPRLVAIAAGVIIAGVAVWMFSHRTSAPVEAKAPGPPAATQKPGSIIRDCPTCPTMTVLPAGRFKQGSPPGGAPSFEQPQHWVGIGKPYAISTTPVTVDEFASFVAAKGREVQGCDTYDGAWKHRTERSWKDPGFSQTGTHPVVCVSSNDAAAYAGWLSTQTGHKYRLPSASEWEYAARAGSEAAQPWGAIATDACRYANVADQSAADQYPGWHIFGCDDAYVNTSPVGAFEPNAFGLKDMLGNVIQWTEDCWNADYTGAPVNGSARTDGDCGQRELRGSSWFSSPDFVRFSYRNHFAADYRASSIGIRVVRELEP
jgi:formylglycine-generating enzyme required for sulfatase activity